MTYDEISHFSLPKQQCALMSICDICSKDALFILTGTTKEAHK